MSALLVSKDNSDGARDEIEGKEAIDEAVSLILGELSGTYRYGSDSALELFREASELCFDRGGFTYDSCASPLLYWSLTIQLSLKVT